MSETTLWFFRFDGQTHLSQIISLGGGAGNQHCLGGGRWHNIFVWQSQKIIKNILHKLQASRGIQKFQSNK